MKCINCQENISDNSIYCTHCGNPVNNVIDSKKNNKDTFDKIKKDNNTSNIKKHNFFTVKNIAIIILSFLFFCSIVGQPNTTELENNIKSLNLTITKLEEEIDSNQVQIDKLQNENTNLKVELEELKDKDENLKSASEITKNTSQTNESSSNTTSISSHITNQYATQDNNTTEMVWVGDTGTKYHIQSCGTLKGKGHQITYQQAIAEGREPCKVCH